MGVKRGSRVALWSYNSANWLIAFFAIVRAGGTAVLVNYSMSGADAVRLLVMTETGFLLCGDNGETKKDPDAMDKLASLAGIPKDHCLDIRPAALDMGYVFRDEAEDDASDDSDSHALLDMERKIKDWAAGRQQSMVDEPGDADETTLIEGNEIQIRAIKYERYSAAREQCIKHYGTICRICGFDFGATYGPEFAGIIEVHHIVPLSQIREDYVVDPIRDLIPVCSNCHTALHSVCFQV